MGCLELKGVGKRYGGVPALEGVDLTVEAGEIFGLTGPSGSGKTTTCRIIAGVEPLTQGEVRIDGSCVNRLSPQERAAAFMFESYALYPHMTVFDNIAFPLRAPARKGRYPRAEERERVRRVLRLVELEGFEKRYPSELSGGQKQRVALCRALVQEPTVYLLDEPLSHLDAKLRHELRGEIRRMLTRSEVPTVWTSPDALETLAAADRLGVLVGGRVVQMGSPNEVYRRPNHVAVARLMGDPAMNLLEGRLEQAGDAFVFRHPAFSLRLADGVRRRVEEASLGDRIILGIRPGDIGVQPGERSDGAVSAEIYVYEPLGKYGILSVRLDQDVVKVKVHGEASYRIGDSVSLDLARAELLAFDPRTGRSV